MAVQTRGYSKSVSMLPPVGGWDTRNAIADMPEENAVILDNWFPDVDKCTIRPPHTSHATGLGSAVDTLLEYTGVDGTGAIFGVAGGSIYDVTSPGAVGAADVSGLSNSRFQQVQIGTAGGQFLFACNGVDTPQTFDGTSWANASITGPTAANLIWCNLHQRRLWFGEKDSLTAYYLAVNSISGSASSFSLAGLAKRGGYIMAMGTWTRDAGDGSDDVAVFLTSEGEAILYSGTDPSDSTLWSLVGVFRIGRPIGRRCMIKAGSDLVMITEDGFVSAASILAIDRSQTEQVAISGQIKEAVNAAVRDNGTLFGWQPFLYPKGIMLIFNVPQSTTTAHQYVFNTITGAPCRFKGINALCWGIIGDTAYIGDSSGVVHKFDTTANDDNGTPIAADGIPAFSYFGDKSSTKSFKRVEPVFQGSNAPNIAVDLHTDFLISSPQGTASPSTTTSNAATWGVSKWGVGVWGTSNQVFQGWRGVRGKGRAATCRIRITTSTERHSWLATNFLYVTGGHI